MILAFEISKLALNDLDEIWEYTAEQWSKQQANKYYTEILQIFNEICNNPGIGNPIDQVKKGHRKIIVKTNMSIYKTSKNKVYIDRILHQKMDIEKHLNE